MILSAGMKLHMNKINIDKITILKQRNRKGAGFLTKELILS